MKRYLGIGAAWLGATVLSVFIASAAVAGIRDRVVETPVAIGPPTTSTTQAPVDTTTSTLLEVPSTAPQATTEPSASTAEPPSETTTTVVDSATTTAAPVTTTTTTTAPPQTTTTAAPSYLTYPLVGGTVTLGVANGEVWVVSLDPAAGFDADIEKDGPDEVEVDFESNTHKSELSAKFENGELRVKTEEEARDGEDD